MNIIAQSVEILTDLSPGRVEEIFALLEAAGRTCYKSEDKIGLTNCWRCNNITSKHPCPLTPWHKPLMAGLNPQVPTSFDFVSKIMNRHHESVLEHAVISVRFITDRGVTHEEVRHRLCSYSQESTRYCNYGGKGITYILPVDFVLNEEDLDLLDRIEKHYQKAIETKRLIPQQARYFLPTGLKTEIVHTANIREWRHILGIRTGKPAHPQIRALMQELLDQLVSKIPLLFDNIEVHE